MLVDNEMYVASRRYLIDYGMRILNGLGERSSKRSFTLEAHVEKVSVLCYL
jgi:hypothetical protein